MGSVLGPAGNRVGDLLALDRALDEEGRLRPAGSASLGLDADRRATLLDALAQNELPRGAARRGGGARWAAPVIEIFVDSHGSPAGPVRDAIMREILVP